MGQERVAEVQRRAEAYPALPLPAAAAESDGSGSASRLRDAAAAGESGLARRHEKGRDAKDFWQETLAGCCPAAGVRMTSEEHAQDPCPTIPRTFVDLSADA